MMIRKWLKGLFCREVKTAPASMGDLERILSGAALAVFQEHWEVLLEQPSSYIVPAIWDANREGNLDSVQAEIHAALAPVVGTILDRMAGSESPEVQRYTFRYLLNGLLIYKINYMVEFYRNRAGDPEGVRLQSPSLLAEMAPAGRA